MLHELRWRKPPRDPRQLWLALLAALALHVVFVAGLWYEMKPDAQAQQLAEAQRDQPIHVRFITHRPTAPPPPSVAPPPPPSREPVTAHAMTARAPASAPPAVQPPAAASAPRPMLFDRSGQALLPASASTAPAATDYVQRQPQGDTQIMQHRDVIKYRPTRLDPYWRKSSNAIDDALQKAVEKTTVSKTVQLPKGIRIRCGISLAALAGGCGGADPPPPPPPTDGDERLDMAPPPLVKGAIMPRPDVSTCIADYRAGKPLPYGCPVDTPTRAVDAERAKRH